MKKVRLITYLLLMLSVPASALREKTEKENLDELRRFSWNMYFFYQSFPQEKIFLQLDNTAYFQGETIWFKGYVVNSENLKRTQSGVLYVELISPNGVILEQKKVRIIAGQCDGNFRLYDSSTEQARELRGIQPYPSGFYEIRAYTQNMLDFDDRACFSRVIPIYRAPEYEGKYEDPVITYMDSPIEQRRPDTEIPEDVNVEFFPEGGHLINGIPTRIAFKCTDKSGENIDGVLSFRKGDAEGVRTVHDGMGSFLYIPGKNDNHVIFRTGEKDYSFTLPKAEASGYSLKADIMTDNDLQLRILHTKDRKEGSIGVSVTCRGKLIYFKEFLSSSDTLMNVSMKNWPLGVCRILLFSRKGEILASRSIFHDNSHFVPPALRVASDKETYSPYDPIKLRFMLTDRTGTPIRDRFALSVRDYADYGTGYDDNLLINLIMSSDLKGFINNPDYYFFSPDDKRVEALDLLMQIHGWERYEWSDMDGFEKFKEKHRIEQGLNLNGWVLSSSKRKGLDGVTVNTTLIPRDSAQTQQAAGMTRNNGYFGLDLIPYQGKADLIVSLSTKKHGKETKARIMLERGIKPAIEAYSAKEVYIPSEKRYTLDSLAAGFGNTQVRIPDVVMLPEVDINSQRKYIDYYTFHAFDVEEDVEAELDLGELSTDIQNYLLEKGYDLWFEGSESLLVPDSLFNDADIAYWMAERSRLNGSHAFWYVHNRERCLYSGVYSPAWAIDTRNVKSLMVFNEPISIAKVPELTPLLKDNITRTQTLADPILNLYNDEITLREKNRWTNYYVIDVLMKDDAQILSRKELKRIGKRITTLSGYSRPVQFYSPQYPDGPIEGQPKDYRRTLYWNPNVITDSLGYAEVEFYNNSYSTHFNVSGAGITASGTPYVLDQDF